MANAVNMPALDDRRTKATFALFKELGCLRGAGADDDVTRLDEEKMMARALDCLAAVCEAQCIRVARGKPLKLKQDGDALTSEQQAARNKVFRVALKAVSKGLTHDGAPERDDLGCFTGQLLRAFPDSGKLTDGRGWLPMHWAVVADEDKESGVTEADVMCMYETDPMALRKHHLINVTDAESLAGKFGYTPAHMLCGLEMTEKNMSLVRQLSMFHSRAFTTKAVDRAAARHNVSALHVACLGGKCTEALFQLLVQLDPSQVKSIPSSGGGPLGLLCANSDDLDERVFSCLLEADSSVEVVYDGITGCFMQNSSFKNRVQTVAKLLEINPAAAKHKDELGRNLAHQACIYSSGMTCDDCFEILKLLRAHDEDALKEVDSNGKLPARVAAECGPAPVLDFVLSEYPEAAVVVDSKLRNLLHIVAEHDGSDEHRAAKARLLCARFPDMMLQREESGYTPLLRSCLAAGDTEMARLLCEAGGREVASTVVQHPTDAQFIVNGRLPLHMLIDHHASTLKTKPLSAAADAFRLLLRLYPEAAGTEGGRGGWIMKPFKLAFDHGLPAYYLRLLLHAAPDVDPRELRRLNWAERRMAMYVAFATVAKTRLLLVKLRVANKDLVKHVVSYL